MPEAFPATPQAYPPPPTFAGLEWEDRGAVSTRRGPRRLHRAEATVAFRASWMYVGRLLRDAGISVEEDGRGQIGAVLHWGDGTDVTVAIREAMAHSDAEARRQYWERRDQENAAAVRTARAKRELQETLDAIGWAMAPASVVKAKALLARASMQERHLEDAAILVRRARQAVERAQTYLAADAAEVPEDDLARCADGDVRAAVLAGCRYLSSRDDDHATAQNGMGWSQATSRPGHLLARESYLDAAHAVLGLRLLRRHRRQLPDDLRGMLGLRA